jgi:ppGpp synthetase/RelA/SpoT-type nucleotidyltranferase
MESILAEYESICSIYDAFRLSMENLVKQILQADGINVHTVQSRLKARKSLMEKLQRPGKSYSALHEVTDLAGIRIITFFEDDVDRVGKVIEREFAVDKDHSIDKRKSWESDRFGYMSLHFVASLSDHRRTLIEYRRFKDIACEIQVRSILQHTWAEIEHDLGYKSSSNVPKHIRRKFSQLSSLLEMADGEFCGIRDELSKYLEEATSKLVESPADLELDDVTIRALIEEDVLVKEVDEGMAKGAGRFLVDNRGVYRILVAALRSVGLTTVAMTQTKLRADRPVITKAAALWLRQGERIGTLGRGVSLAYLYMLTLAEQTNDDPNKVAEGFMQHGFFEQDERLRKAEELIANIKLAKKDD